MDLSSLISKTKSISWHTYAHSHCNRGSKCTHNLRKNSHILLKTFFLRLSFPDEGRLYAKFLFDIFTIYPKCHLFQFFSRGIRLHIPILTVVQNEPKIHRKDIVFCWKMFLSKLFYVEEGHFYANCLFIFLLFMLNTFFSGSEVVAYLCLLPSLQGFKMNAQISEKTVRFC